MKKCATLFLCVFLMTACGEQGPAKEKGVQTGNAVHQVIQDQMANEGGMGQETDASDDAFASETNPGDAFPTPDANAYVDTTESSETFSDLPYHEYESSGNTEIPSSQSDGSVDYDLTAMGSDMVFATVYQLMMAPEEYEGNIFRIEGSFYATYYEPAQKYYFYCVIQDATACCAQGLEFVWGDGSHLYPDEYPKEDTDIIVEGRFETYREEGDPNLYCRLADATLQQENMDKSNN